MSEFTDMLVRQISLFGITDLIDICVVAYVMFQLIKLLRETRAIQLVKGLLALVAVYLAAYILQLRSISFLMQNVFQIGAIALIVLFQPELRKVLEQMGRTRVSALGAVFAPTSDNETEIMHRWEDTINTVCDACATMSRQKVGALMIFERSTPLGDVIATGTIVDAQPSYELINNLFFKNSPLHDGAVILRNGRVYAAGCVLPLSANFTISRELGTRHRAALGMSENSDAISLVVSEENGKISLAENGVLKRDLSIDELRSELRNGLILQQKAEPRRLNFRLIRKDAAQLRKEATAPDENH